MGDVGVGMSPEETADIIFALEAIREVCANGPGCVEGHCPAWDPEAERCICSPEDMSPCSWVFPWDAGAPLER